MAIKFLNTVQVDTDVLYVDASSNRVGIGTTSPSTVLEVSSTGVNGVDISQSASNATQSGRLFFTTNTASEGFALFNANGTFQINSGGIPNDTSGTNRISIIGSSGNVGIGTTSPSTKLHVSGGDIRIDDTERIEFGAGGVRINNDAAGRMYYRAPLGFYWETNGGYRMTIDSSGNVGIGTTSPGEKLQVDGVIDANGSDGYKINGKAWAVEVSNNLQLGDWDGQEFSTSIYDNNSANIVTIKDYGTTINCSSLISTYGDSASLAVGTIGSSSAGAAVITLANRDTTASAGDPTGAIQFAIKADTIGNTLGYTSAIISGSIFANAGTGNAGGGILDFKTSPTGIGSSPVNRIRINQLGDVGIGTTSPSEKLEVDGNVKADNYINQRVAWNVGFLASSVNTSSYYYIPVGYLSETTSNQYYNNWVASYAGRVRKIVMRNLGSGSTPTATTINFRITVNGTVTYTGGNATITGSGLNQIATHEFNPGSSGSPFFNATDRVQVAYRTNGLWQYAATSISLEYTE